MLLQGTNILTYENHTETKTAAPFYTGTAVLLS